MNITFDMILMIESIQCLRAVKNPKQLSTTSCAAIYSIYRLELLNYICALNHSLKNISEENLLKVLIY